jgi:hypothetical protein
MFLHLQKAFGAFSNMHPETLAPRTKKVLELLGQYDIADEFYLAGGTALALQYGHRQSVDLDWFTREPIDTVSLVHVLSQIGTFTPYNIAKNTVEGLLNRVKVSFMTYPYPLLKKTVEYEGVKLAHPHDIAAMKIGAIAGRNTKKDFIDLFLFLERQELSLVETIELYKKRAKGIDIDEYHLYRALSYFTESDKEPMPKMLIPLTWIAVKKFFINEVKKIL